MFGRVWFDCLAGFGLIVWPGLVGLVGLVRLFAWVWFDCLAVFGWFGWFGLVVCLGLV